MKKEWQELKITIFACEAKDVLTESGDPDYEGEIDWGS